MNETEKTAEELKTKAAFTATQLKEMAELTAEILADKQENKRFIDIGRIPLICQSILEINDSLASIKKTLDERFITKDRYLPVERLVYGQVGIIGGVIIVEVLHLIFVKSPI
jgi:hypothetical protein